MIEYKDIKVFSKKVIDEMRKEDVEISRIGKVDLDYDEMAILKLPPKFAIRRKLDIVVYRVEQEMGMAKVRYQVHKENRVRDIEENGEIGNGETTKTKCTGCLKKNAL